MRLNLAPDQATVLQARRALRRGAPAFGLALVLFLLAIPALWDLRGLFVGLGIIAAGLGLVTVAFNYFDKPLPPRNN